MVFLLVGGIGATGALGSADAQRLFFMPFQAATGGEPAEQPATAEAAPEVTSTDGGGLVPAASPADNAGSGGGEDDPGTSRGEETPGAPPAG
jgi:hypothetical protein